MVVIDGEPSALPVSVVAGGLGSTAGGTDPALRRQEALVLRLGKAVALELLAMAMDTLDGGIDALLARMPQSIDRSSVLGEPRTGERPATLATGLLGRKNGKVPPFEPLSLPVLRAEALAQVRGVASSDAARASRVRGPPSLERVRDRLLPTSARRGGP
jgi:hypothetical protein